ncbi:hypothetical protein KRX54_07405 [Actinomycetaceae bacterium TAE3-ERU4]|nr:hypothetical protein [Actinomycetaceae bacterium TAE3-ERU4]
MENKPARNRLEACGLIVALICTVSVAAFGMPTLAVYMLSGICIVNALSRLLRRDKKAWNKGKNWQIDTAFYLLLALGLILLAPATKVPGIGL